MLKQLTEFFYWAGTSKAHARLFYRKEMNTLYTLLNRLCPNKKELPLTPEGFLYKTTYCDGGDLFSLTSEFKDPVSGAGVSFYTLRVDNYGHAEFQSGISFNEAISHAGCFEEMRASYLRGVLSHFPFIACLDQPSQRQHISARTRDLFSSLLKETGATLCAPPLIDRDRQP